MPEKFRQIVSLLAISAYKNSPLVYRSTHHEAKPSYPSPELGNSRNQPLQVSTQGKQTEAATSPPNIVLIIADDLGYGELGVQGCTEIPTPHIDSIARNGTRFTDGYATCSMCHPSRAGMMTGRHQVRFGIEGNPPTNDQGTQLRRPDDRTHARGAPQEAGLHHRPFRQVAPRCTHELTPLRRGFDEFYGIHHGGHSFLPTSKQRTKGPLMRGDQEITEETYLTTALGREAVTFVDRHHRAPFFLCLSFTAVHKPLEATEADLKRFPDMEPGKRKTHAAMTVSMDDAVGKVLASLRAHDLEKNTLIIFISDNGGFRAIASRNTPLRGAKWNLFEGGNRVPFAMQWTGRIPAGKVYEKPVSALDILPTSVVAAGGTIDAAWKLDGVNLMPFLQRHRPGAAARDPLLAHRRAPGDSPRQLEDDPRPRPEAAGPLRPLAGYRRTYRPRRARTRRSWPNSLPSTNAGPRNYHRPRSTPSTDGCSRPKGI